MAKRSVLTAGILIGLCIASVLVFNFYLSPGTVAKKTVEEQTEKSRQQLIDEAQIVAEDVELVQGQQGSVEWKLLAKTAKYNQEKKLVGVTVPRLTAFYGEDRREVFISADRGEVDQTQNNLTLYDNVVGRFGGMDIEAPYLDYVGHDDMVFIKGGVNVKRPDLDMKADEAEINLESRVLVATGNVVAIFTSVGLKQ
jgi:LPS export ABC transporter protein LptC